MTKKKQFIISFSIILVAILAISFLNYQTSIFGNDISNDKPSLPFGWSVIESGDGYCSTTGIESPSCPYAKPSAQPVNKKQFFQERKIETNYHGSLYDSPLSFTISANNIAQEFNSKIWLYYPLSLALVMLVVAGVLRVVIYRKIL